MVALLLLLSLSIVLSYATWGINAECLPPPIVVPIDNVPISNFSSPRGMFVTVGSNLQNISMLPNGESNNTAIYGPNADCDGRNFTTKACLTYRGGVYDVSQSSSGTPLSEKTDEHFWVDPLLVRHDLRFSGTNVSVNSFDFIMPRTSQYSSLMSQAQLGLGRNSTVLKALQETGHIGTRAYSLFWGLAGGPESKQSPGSLILGGLDRARISDQAESYTAPLNYDGACETGMLVTISDIQLHWTNGSDANTFMGSQSTALQACIRPGFAGLMSLPSSYYQNYLSLTGGRGAEGRSEARSGGTNFNTMLLDPTNVYSGALEIKIQNTMSIRIENDQLIVPEPFIPSYGFIERNYSVRNVVINSIPSYDKRLPEIGSLFMSSAYLAVNHEANEFTIWQANTESKTTDLVALDEKNNIVSELCNQGSTDSDATSSAAPSPADQARRARRLSRGAIGGIVVGAVIAIGAAILIGYCLHRRRRRPSATALVHEEKTEV